MLAFQSSEIYKAAIELVGFTHRLSREDDEVVDRLRFVALTIPIDVATAESGAGGGTQRRATMAEVQASAIESAVLLDALRACAVVPEGDYASGVTLVGRILAAASSVKGSANASRDTRSRAR